MARERGRHMDAIALVCGEGCPAGLLDQLPQGVFWKDLRLRYLGCNSVFLNRIGLGSAEELLGRTDSQLLDPETARAFEESDRKVLDSGEPVTEVYREDPAHGEGPRWVETLKKPLVDGNGKTVGILGIPLDVTGRMLSQAALDMIRNAAGTMFDPDAVASCLRLFSRGFLLSSYGPSLPSDPMERLRND